MKNHASFVNVVSMAIALAVLVANCHGHTQQEDSTASAIGHGQAKTTSSSSSNNNNLLRRHRRRNEETMTSSPAPTTSPTMTMEPTVTASPTVSSSPTDEPTITASPTTSASPTVTASPTPEPTMDPTAMATAGGVQLNDIICVEGYIMDWFCIERGTLLDNSSVRTLEGPEEHSLHCLVDVGICYESWFEVLATPLVLNEDTGNMEYQRGWRLYETSSNTVGKQMVIDLGRQTGDESDCDTCTGTGEGSLEKGFRAAIRGRLIAFASVDEDGETVPPLIDVIEVEASHNTADPCGTFFNMQQQDVL